MGAPENYGKLWTREDDTRLQAAFKAGVPVVDIALELGRTKSAIFGRLQVFDLVSWDTSVRQYYKLVWLGR